MNKGVRQILLPVVLMFAAFATISCQESLTERCAREAQIYTSRNCPAKISENITLDSITFFDSDSTICYNYHISGILLDSIENLSQRKDEYKALMLKDLRASTDLKGYKDAGFNFEYVYLSAKNPKQILLEFKYKKEDYN